MPDTYKNPAENGFYYCQTRYYDSTVGRFLNADGVLATGVSSICHNMYAYCWNNAICLTDSKGLAPCYCLLRSIDVCLYCGRTTTPGVQSSTTGLDLKENPFLNPDDSISLYDNQRDDEGGYNHSQILAFTYETPSLSSEGFGIGASASFITCGWEFEKADISLFDFCTAEAGASVNRTGASVGAGVSLWSPSISFQVWDIEILLGAEVLSVGAKAAFDMEKGINLSVAYGFGFDIAILW